MRRRWDDSGATSVEFALVLPILTVVMATGAYFGWYIYVQSQVERAATRAARYAAVPTTSGSYDYCPSSVLQTVNANLVSERATSAELLVEDASGAATPATPCSTIPQKYVRVTVTHVFANPFTSLVALVTPLSAQVAVVGRGQADVETP